MTESGFIPPRVSSSPPPFEENFDDLHSVDSSEKEDISSGLDLTNLDFDGADDAETVSGGRLDWHSASAEISAFKPSQWENQQGKVPKSSRSIQEDYQIPVSSSSSSDAGILEENDLPTQQTGRSASDEPQQNPLPSGTLQEQKTLSEEETFAVRKNGERRDLEEKRPSDALPVPQENSSKFQPENLESCVCLSEASNKADSGAVCLSEASNKVDSGAVCLSDTATGHGHDSSDRPFIPNEIEEAFVESQNLWEKINSAFLEEDLASESVLIGDWTSAGRDSLPEIAYCQSPSAATETESEESSQWADFAGPSTDRVSPAISALVQSNTQVAAETEDDWGDFSDFSPGLPDAQSIPAAEITEETGQLQKNFSDTFDETIVSVFPLHLEASSESVPLDLDRSANVAATAQTPATPAYVIWTVLKNLDETYALKFHWGSSVIRQALLRSLSLSYLSAFSMQKKDAVQLSTANRRTNDMLLPVKLDPSRVVASDSQRSQDEASSLPENKPKEDAFNRQLLDFLGPVSESKKLADLKLDHSLSPHQRSTKASLVIADHIPNGTSTILLPEISPSAKPHPNGNVNVTVKQKNDVDEVIARFRSLNFMQSNVLVVPKVDPGTKKVAKF